jgi:hypothetical protein
MPPIVLNVSRATGNSLVKLDVYVEDFCQSKAKTFSGRGDCSTDSNSEEDGDEGGEPRTQYRAEAEGERGVDCYLRRTYRESRVVVNKVATEKKCRRKGSSFVK